MIRRSQGCRPVRPAVVRRPRQVQKRKEEQGKSIQHSHEYMMLALKFMFAANGIATTTLLINNLPNKSGAALLFYSCGVAATIFSTLSLSLMDDRNILKKNIVYRILNYSYIATRIIIVVFPCILFILGIFFSIDIFASIRIKN
ncbi:hypothetical protein [uncultured Desulfovibrio sp.]|uniref:hypothetical protein n=1 Tax=uncultured Desulfovibrio sp. TaxID=167968 RepID=UPI002613E443|nr:hypothetical protein [uncultured Desulfovibrio sp.]